MRFLLATFLLMAAASVSAAGAATAGETPRYATDIAPILMKNCAQCHRPGEAAPFSLLTYEDARKRGQLIAAVTQSAYMPPWFAERTHYSFANERRLTKKEIEQISKWVEAGMPAGDLSKAPPVPEFPQGWQAGKPDLIVSMAEAFPVPAEGPDIYRYFVLPVDLPEDKWVRAIEFRPGSPSVVHHALVFFDASANLRPAAGDGKPGFDGDQAGPDDRFRVATWAVGTDARVLPDGLAIRMPKGANVVVQTHFHPSGKPEREVSSVGLYFAEEPPQTEVAEIHIPPFFGIISGIDIPAGDNAYTLRESFTTPVDVKAFAAFPHAHYIGKEFRMTAELPDGEKRDLLWVKRWNFEWQTLYTFEEPFALPAGTKVTSEITWDNSAKNPSNPYNPPRRIKWGPYSADEMGSIILDVTTVRPEDMEKLRAASKRHYELALANLMLSRENALSNGLNGLRGGQKKIGQAVLKQFDKDSDGSLGEQELEQARAYLSSKGFDKGLRRGRSGD